MQNGQSMFTHQIVDLLYLMKVVTNHVDKPYSG